MKVKVYEKNEFVVEGLEIRRAELSEEYINDDSCWGGYVLETLDIYKDGEQIDVEDESVISDELWCKIEEMIGNQIIEENCRLDGEW